MKKWLSCALALCVSPVSAQFDKPNFSGSWKPVPEKSTTRKTLKEKPGPDAPPAPPPAPPGAQVPPEFIQHRGPNLRITRVLPEGRISMMNFTTDGKENLNVAPGAAISHRSRSHWDGEILVTEWELLRDGKAFMHGKDTRWMSRDGRKMIVHSTMEDSLSKSVAHKEWKKLPGLLPLRD